MSVTTHKPPQRERRVTARRERSAVPALALTSAPSITSAREAIEQAIFALAGLLPALPMPLSLDQRRSAAPRCFSTALSLARTGIRLLRDHRAELPEADEDPEELAALQDHVERLNRLRALLQEVLTLVNDAYLDGQSQVVARVRAAAHRVRVANQTFDEDGAASSLLRDSLLAQLDALDPRSPDKIR